MEDTSISLLKIINDNQQEANVRSQAQMDRLLDTLDDISKEVTCLRIDVNNTINSVKIDVNNANNEIDDLNVRQDDIETRLKLVELFVIETTEHKNIQKGYNKGIIAAGMAISALLGYLFKNIDKLINWIK